MTNFASLVMKKYEGIEYPAVILTTNGRLGQTEYTYSVKKLIAGEYNNNQNIHALLDCLQENLPKKNHAALAARMAIQKAVHVWPDGTIHKNPWNKNSVSAKIVTSLANVGLIKTTNTSWLLGGQLSDNGTADGLEQILQDCPTLEIIESLNDWGIVNNWGITAKAEDLPEDKLNVIQHIMGTSWFKEARNNFDYSWIRQLNQDENITVRPAISELRENVNRFRGEDMEEVPQYNEEAELNRQLKDEHDYGYTLENIGFAIARLIALDLMVMNHPVLKKYSPESVEDFLYKSGNHLILGEILHTQDMAEKLQNVGDKHGNEFFMEIFNILNTTKGLSLDAIAVKKAMEVNIINNLHNRPRVYTKTTQNISGIPCVKVTTYGEKFDKIEQQIRNLVASPRCTESVQRALASMGMYGAAKKRIAPYFIESDSSFLEFEDIDWEVETSDEELFNITVEFEEWANKFFENRQENKNKARQAAKNEATIDSKRGSVVLSLNELVCQDDASDDLAKLNDPNFAWDQDFDLAF